MSFLNILADLLWRYRRLAAVIIAVVFIQIFEITLLNYKYDIFTGGFLQPYAYMSLSDRLNFILLSLWFDVSFFGAIAGLWFFIADRLN
ncbi:MAG: hypothetical protein ABL919_07035, partial [Methylococcales bacterium]